MAWLGIDLASADVDALPWIIDSQNRRVKRLVVFGNASFVTTVWMITETQKHLNGLSYEAAAALQTSIITAHPGWTCTISRANDAGAYRVDCSNELKEIIGDESETWEL